MAKLTDLPQELLRETARNVDKPRTLRSASLTCKHLQVTFQECLFSRVHRISAKVVSSPRLCRCIQSFSISIGSREDVYDLKRVLAKASSIRELLIREEDNLTESLFDYDSDEEDSSLHELTSTLSNLHLVEVHVHGIFFTLPLSIFKKCRELKTLSISELFTEWVSLPLLEPEEKPIQLETLQLVFKKYTEENVVEWLLEPRCLLDIQKLKSLNIVSFSYGSKNEQWELMRRCLQTLEIIRIDIGCPKPDDMDEWYSADIPETAEDFKMLDFSVFPNLRIIEIRMELNDNVDDIIKHAFCYVSKDTPIHLVILDVLINDEQFSDGVNLDWIATIFTPDRFTNNLRLITTFYHKDYDSEQYGEEEFVKKTNLPLYNYIETRFCAKGSSGPFLYFDSGFPTENGRAFRYY